MRLKPIKKLKVEMEETTPRKKKNKKDNKLPPDGYKPMFTPKRFLVRETPSSKDETKMVKQYLELSVKRYDDDDVNDPMVYVQMYQESEAYTGYLKGKSIYLPLEALYDLIDGLDEISEECERRGIE